jgi:capsular polysaccharide transport system permease protein
LVPILTRPLYFVSGVFFSIEVVPEPYRSWLLLNPLLHANELMRAGFFATCEARYADPGYLIAWIGGCLCLGLLMQRALRRWLRVTA